MNVKLNGILFLMLQVIIIYSACNNADKNDIKSLEPLAEKAYHNEDYSKSLDLYTKITLLDSTNALYFFRKGVSNAHLLKHAEAILDLKKSFDLDGGSAHTFFDIALEYKHLGFFDSTILYLQKSLALDSSNNRAKDIIEECELFLKLDKRLNNK